MNKIIDTIYTGNTMVFIIKTGNEKGFWYWQVDREEVNEYRGTHEEFVNDEDNATLGCSTGTFNTIEETLIDIYEVKPTLNKRWFWKVARVLNEGTRYFSDEELKENVNDYFNDYLISLSEKKRTSLIDSLLECIADYDETKLYNELATATTF